MINNTIQMIPEMISIKSASARTGMSYEWIRKMCKQGRLVHIKSGSKYLINFGKLVDYLNAGEQKGGSNNEEHLEYQ